MSNDRKYFMSHSIKSSTRIRPSGPKIHNELQYLVRTQETSFRKLSTGVLQKRGTGESYVNKRVSAGTGKKVRRPLSWRSVRLSFYFVTGHSLFYCGGRGYKRAESSRVGIRIRKCSLLVEKSSERSVPRGEKTGRWTVSNKE